METLRPAVSLVFVAPFLITYEAGVVMSSRQEVRNGVDAGVQWLLGSLGFGHILILPLITIGALLFLHHRCHDRWSIHPWVLTGMVLESVALGLILVFGSKGHFIWLQEAGSTRFLLVNAFQNGGSAAEALSAWEQIVVCFGAGLYEELVFRLLLLGGVILLLKRTGIRPERVVIPALLATSLLFAAAHYDFINPAGAAFDLPSFAVRTLASIFLGTVFLLRGFGVAVGAHITYNVAVWLAG
jgi:membrane protease YdiL (CAAX protease family)